MWVYLPPAQQMRFCISQCLNCQGSASMWHSVSCLRVLGAGYLHTGVLFKSGAGSLDSAQAHSPYST